MGAHTRFEKLQDEFVDLQISATNALAYIKRFQNDGQRFLLEAAENQLRECAANHYLQGLIGADALSEHLYVRKLRADRRQLELIPEFA